MPIYCDSCNGNSADCLHCYRDEEDMEAYLDDEQEYSKYLFVCDDMPDYL